MIGNNGMENIFGKIESKKFVGFSGGSGQKKQTVGSNRLKNNRKNNQTLSTDNGEQGWIFHPHGSSQDRSGAD